MDYGFSKIKEFLKHNKYILTLLKALVVFVSVYFLINIFIQNYQKIKDLSLFSQSKIYLFLLGSSILYGGFLKMLALGWKNILEILEKRKLDTRITLIYLTSLVYKYIPGNIFHYASRQIAANKLGVKHSNLLKSNFYEAILLIITALMFSIILIFQWKKCLIYITIVSILFISLLIFTLYKKILIAQIAIKSIPYYYIYFLGIGGLCFYVIEELTPINIPFLQCVALYSAAWIIGFITPGAPGGLGVRESVFILLSHNLIDPPEAIFIISLLRISTTLGEVLVYLYAKFISTFHQNKACNEKCH